MKAIVGVKRVVDYAVKIRVKPDGSGVNKDVKMSMNPFCELAVEECLRLKDKGILKEILAVSIGPQKSEEVLRSALALGATRALHVKTDIDLSPLDVAKIFANIQKKENADLLMFGKQSIDDDFAATPPMTAALIDAPQALYAAKVDVDAGSKTATVTCEADSGTREVKVNLPAVISADLRLNELRFVSLPAIMKAKKAKIEAGAPEDFGVTPSQPVEYKKWAEPPSRPEGVKVADVTELLSKLKNEAKVL